MYLGVWYQKAKAKQWCILCIIILVLLWVIFLIDWCFGYMPNPDVASYNLHPALSYWTIPTITFLVVVSCYFASIVVVNMLIPKLNTDKLIQSLRQSINSMKAEESVFASLLMRQPYFKTNECNSVIHFGNPDSKLQLTVLSNPYCNPCAKMHKRIHLLL
jgi:hypothetical protein